jgi:hypothetical protein
MNLSWIDELVSAELVLPSWLISEIKTTLQSKDADDIMEKMVKYKQARLNTLHIEQVYTKETPILERWIADNAHVAYQTQKKVENTLRRELMVMLRGEDAVKEGEAENEKRTEQEVEP